MNSTSETLKIYIEKSHKLLFLRGLSSLNEFNYKYTAFIIGACQFLLNLAVVFIILFNKFKGKLATNQFLFIFIFNLALEDILSFGIVITDVIYNQWIFSKGTIHEPRGHKIPPKVDLWPTLN